MYCKSCGHVSADEAAFCSKCGAAVAVTRSEPVAPPIKSALDPASSAAWPEEWEFDEELWRRAIGPRNTDYYLWRFQRKHDGDTSLGWHWPAFFILTFWLLYRRMWGWAALYCFGGFAIGIPAGLIARHLTPEAGVALIRWSTILLTLAAIVLGYVVAPLVANNLYYLHLKKMIARQRAQAKSRALVLKNVEARGGTGIAGHVLAAILLVCVLLEIIAISIYAYQERANHKKATVAIVAGKSVARQVDAYVNRNRALPTSLTQFSTDAGPRQFISGMEMDSRTGVITIKVSFSRGSSAGNIYFVPSGTDWTRNVAWRCRAEEKLQEYAPPDCVGE
jgi:Protein of unknown function (DUF2628)